MITVKINKSDYAGLVFEDGKSFLQATTPTNPKGLPRDRKRLARIKRNLLRELSAFNKEMRRFPTERAK